MQIQRITTFAALVSWVCCVATANGADVVPSAATVHPQTAELAAVRDTLSKTIESGKFPSLAIGVARGTKVLWLEGLGAADRESHVAANPDTLYPVASVSKSITGTLCAILVQKGLLH